MIHVRLRMLVSKSCSMMCAQGYGESIMWRLCSSKILGHIVDGQSKCLVCRHISLPSIPVRMYRKPMMSSQDRVVKLMLKEIDEAVKRKYAELISPGPFGGGGVGIAQLPNQSINQSINPQSTIRMVNGKNLGLHNPVPDSHHVLMKLSYFNLVLVLLSILNSPKMTTSQALPMLMSHSII